MRFAWMALASVLALGPAVAAPPEEVVETDAAGVCRARYEVDAERRRHGRYVGYHPDGTTVAERSAWQAGLRHGAFSTYHPSGKPWVTAAYESGQLHKRFTEKDLAGKPVRMAGYAHGLLDGPQQVFRDGLLVSDQLWRAGRLERIGVRPRRPDAHVVAYPRPLADVRRTLLKILEDEVWLRDAAGRRTREWWSDGEAKPAETVAPESRRAHALRRLKAFRYVVDVPWEDCVLDDTMNGFCDAGARLCEAIGHLDHTPPNPGLPEEEYKAGYRGTSNSNLSAGAPVEFSVDSYMDDSDASNIDRIGHRCWCMNPPLMKVGFGWSGGFSAMWSMDRSRSPVPDFDYVAYPPRGVCPVGFFGPRHAWSVSLNRSVFGKPVEGKVKARIFPLDADLAPAPDPLKLDYHKVNIGGYGISYVLIFRPEKLEMAPGSRYWVELEGLKRQRDKVEGGVEGFLVEFASVERDPPAPLAPPVEPAPPAPAPPAPVSRPPSDLPGG